VFDALHRDLLLEEDVTLVHFLVESHRRDARYLLTTGQCPLDRRRAAIGRQE